MDVDVEPELEKKADLDLESPQRDARQSEIEVRVCVRVCAWITVLLK